MGGEGAFPVFSEKVEVGAFDGFSENGGGGESICHPTYIVCDATVMSTLSGRLEITLCMTSDIVSRGGCRIFGKEVHLWRPANIP